MIKELTVKNFRFWIFIAGIVFLLLGTFFYYFGGNPCTYSDSSDYMECSGDLNADTLGSIIFNLYGLVETFGTFLIILSIIFYISKYISIIKELTVKNFRFWIFIAGIVFLLLGNFFSYFGKDTCPDYYPPGSETIAICDFWVTDTFRETIFGLDVLVYVFSGFLIILSIIFYIINILVNISVKK